MKKHFTLFLLTILFISCLSDKSEKAKKTIIVNLETKGGETPFYSILLPLKYMDSIPEKFKGITNRDSAFLMYHNWTNRKEIEKLKANGKNIDQIFADPKSKLYCLSGINNSKQFFIHDANNNFDFGDDEIIEFNRDIFEEDDYRETFKSKTIEIKKFTNDSLINDSAFIRIYPDPKYFDYSGETSDEQKFKRSLQLAVQTSTYKYGTFNYNNVDYKVAVNDGWKGPEFLFRKLDSNFYPSNHQLYAKYLIKDTFKLKGTYFKLDSINQLTDQLTIKKLSVDKLIYGFRTNEVSKNYEIKDLDGKKTSLNVLMADKNLMLLDFWGTWCAPCKELTPDLVELHNSFGDKVSFVSLAFELDPQPVKEYVIKNGMNWFNGFIKGKPKSGDLSAKIMAGLRVECFPTFILLDRDLNILHRTCGGGNNFTELGNSIRNNINN